MTEAFSSVTEAVSALWVAGTKAWKHVRSITGMWAAALIERDQFEGILQGALCGANMIITEFEYTKLQKSSQVHSV